MLSGQSEQLLMSSQVTQRSPEGTPTNLGSWVKERKKLGEQRARQLIADAIKTDLKQAEGENSTTVGDLACQLLIQSNTRRLEAAIKRQKTGSEAVVTDGAIVLQTMDAQHGIPIRVEIRTSNGAWTATEFEVPSQPGEPERIRTHAFIDRNGQNALTLSFPHIIGGDPNINMNQKLPIATAKTFNLLANLCVPSLAARGFTAISQLLA